MVLNDGFSIACGTKAVKIIEAQVGSILKETDIVRFQDVYGRVK